MLSAITTTATTLNPDVGDRILDEAGHAVVLDNFAAETAQRIFVKLNFAKGEWPLNLDEGTPYFEHILRKGPTDSIIRSVFGSVISKDEGVSQLNKLSYSIKNRRLTLEWTATLKTGVVLKSTDYLPFVVEF